MRVFQVITGLGVGGAETQLASLSEQLARRGHQVMIVYLTGEQALHPKHPGIVVRTAGMQKGPWGTLRGLWRLRQAIASFRPDVVHSHMVHANICARAMRFVAPIPRLVSTVHGMVETRSRSLLLLYKLSDRLSDVTSFVSAAAEELYLAQSLVARTRSQTVHNGIDLDRFRPQLDSRPGVRLSLGVSPDAHLLIAIGRLVHDKDYPTLLRALALMVEKDSSAALVIVGVGPLLGELEALCRALNLTDRVVFAGVRRDIPQLLSAADVFVLSSSAEGFGLVVAEAMACELVPVATDSGGVREVVGDQGVLVPCRDPEALAAGLIKVLQMTAAERRAIGAAARCRIERHYSMERAVERWEQLYRGDAL